MKIYIIVAMALISSQAIGQREKMIDQIKASTTGDALWWAGNDSWIIKSGGLVIGTDLFLENNNRIDPCPVTPEEIAGILDISFVTHAHGDHFNGYTSRILVEKSACLFVIPESCLSEAKRFKIPEDRIVIAKPRVPFEIKGIKVTPLRAIHGNMDFAIYYDANMQDCGYLMNINGKNYLQPGDTYLLEDHLYLKKERGKIKDFHLDVLFFSPTEHNMYIDQSVILINTLDPDYIFPQHHGTIKVAENNYWWTKGYPREVYMRLSPALQARYYTLKPGEGKEIK